MKKELKEYYCFNDYIMECPELKGKAAFLKGKKYLFNNQMIAKSELFDEHDLSDEIDFDRYFILQSEWDLLQQKSGKLPKQQLSIELQLYLGDLLEQYKTTYDYFEKRKIILKINAVELILEVPPTKFDKLWNNLG